MSEYVFPRLFVEGFEGEEYAIVEGDTVKFSKEKKEGALGKVPYEIPLEEIVDLVDEKMKRTILIHLPKKGEALLLKEGTPIKILKASHVKVGMVVNEGDEVSVGDSYAYGLTNKGEVRNLRSLHEGTVVMVHWEPRGDKDVYHVILAPKEKVLRLKVNS